MLDSNNYEPLYRSGFPEYERRYAPHVHKSDIIWETKRQLEYYIIALEETIKQADIRLKDNHNEIANLNKQLELFKQQTETIAGYNITLQNYITTLELNNKKLLSTLEKLEGQSNGNVSNK